MASLLSNKSTLGSSVRCIARRQRAPLVSPALNSRFQSSDLKAPSTSSALPEISWSEYFKIRTSRRRWDVFAAFPTTVAGLAVGISQFAVIESDPTQTIMGLEPVIVYGIATVCCTGFGYLLGSPLGSTLWKLTHSKSAKLVESRDKEFYDRIKKMRVDPIDQPASGQEPVPDFYGEKIGSISGYRQWLRDQDTWRKKVGQAKPPRKRQTMAL